MSKSLVIKPSGQHTNEYRSWELVVRDYATYEPPVYNHVCYLSDKQAEELIETGGVSWLYGDPDWKSIYERRAVALREKAIMWEDKKNA